MKSIRWVRVCSIAICSFDSGPAAIRTGPISRWLWRRGLAHDELEAFGADGSERTSEEEIRFVLDASRQGPDRVELSLNLPFSNFRTFRSYWVAKGP